VQLSLLLSLFLIFLAAASPVHALNADTLSNDPLQPDPAGNNTASADEKAEQAISGNTDPAQQKPVTESQKQADTATSIKQADDKQAAVVFKSLAQMDELKALGVPSLALSLLDGEQKQFREFSAEWYSFEYKRILLLAELSQWQELVERAQWVLDTARDGYQITSKIRTWFRTQQVIAHLQLKQTDRALALLQQVIWQTDAEDRNPELAMLWRQLVIRAYLQQASIEDARRALVTYQNEFEGMAHSTDWLILQARVQLETGYPERALQSLLAIPNQDALDVETLRYIAELQAYPNKAKSIREQMRERLDGKVLSHYQRWAYAYLAYQASKALGDLPAQIENLETVLAINLEIPLFDDGFEVNVDELWSLYNTYGQQLANNQGLLLGAPASWQAITRNMSAEKSNELLAICAAWVMQLNDAANTDQHRQIIELLEQRKNGLGLINKLYLDSELVHAVDQLPVDVRYQMVDYALGEGHYDNAVRLMKTLEEPPKGKTLFDWRMRTARVMLLKGEYSESENLIRQTFAEIRSISRDELDRYLQVVFDFQTVQEHEKALRLFELISFDSLDEQLQREMYFWKAESSFALERYDRAALYYLESAYALADGQFDLWAQSARFKAGTSLMKAGIYDDATKVFTELQAITASDARKAMIEQNLQKIRLLKSAAQHQ
jgi:hypothetical protein